MKCSIQKDTMEGFVNQKRVLSIGDKEYACSFEIAMDLIGSKWKPILVWHLGTKEVLRFNEIRKLLPKITQKMLTQQLRELEHDQLVHREVYPQVPPKVEYSLTEFGQTLMPILRMMCQWGETYYEKVEIEGKEIMTCRCAMGSCQGGLLSEATNENARD